MKILITGGAGYIGTELVKALNQNSSVDEIVVYDNLWKDHYNLFTHSGISRGKVQFVKGELLDSRKLGQALQGVDMVYHLAAHVDSKLINANHHLYEQINNWGTAELSYAIEKSTVKTIVNASTIAVYGHNDQMVEDAALVNPKTFYGSSKLRGEAYLNRLSDAHKVYNLRIGNAYGYGTSLRMDSFINQFVFSAAFENRIKILGKGDQVRPIIHIQSLIEVLCSLIDTKLDSGTYHAVEQNVSVLDVADVLKQILPDMEMLFVSQHLDLRNISVQPNSKLNTSIKHDRTNLKTQLAEFLERLFHSK